MGVTTVPDEGESNFKMPRASVVHMTSTATRPQHMSQVLATLALSMGTLSSGLAKGYTSPALDSILDNQQPHLYQTASNDTWSAFSVTQQEASWVASLSMLGAWLGAMIGDWIMRRGRRLALRASSLPLAAAWILTGVAPRVELVYVTSFIGGLCCSVITMVAQVYISEISMPGIRGCLSAMLKVHVHVGVLLSYIAGTYLNWRQSALLVAIAPSMLFLGTLFIPETPSYLVLNGKDDEAAGSLQWLRGEHVDIRHELQVIKTNILASRAKQYELTFRNSVFTPRLYKPIAITCGLMFFQRFSGANAFTYYAVIIFRQTLVGMNPHRATIAIGFVQLLASLLSGFLIDIVGRLPLLIASTVLMSLALAGFGSYAYYISQTQNLGYPNAAVVGQHDWIPLLCVLVFTTALALGISPISWLLIGELFPLEYRGLGSSISTSFSYFCAFLGIKLFMDFQQILGLHGAFWFYAAVAVCGLCFVVCCVPETKGKQLDEMNPDYAQARGAATSSARVTSPARSNQRRLSDYCSIFAEKTNRIGRSVEQFMQSRGFLAARRPAEEAAQRATMASSNGSVIRNDHRAPGGSRATEQIHRYYNGEQQRYLESHRYAGEDRYAESNRYPGRSQRERGAQAKDAYPRELGPNPNYTERFAELEPRRPKRREQPLDCEERGGWANAARSLNASRPILRNGREERPYCSTLPRRSRTINFRDQRGHSPVGRQGYPKSLQDLTDLRIDEGIREPLPPFLSSSSRSWRPEENYRRRRYREDELLDDDYLRLCRNLSRLDKYPQGGRYEPGQVHYERECRTFGKDTVAFIYYKTCYL
ncbi:hypothetical protein KM043_010156 [Ampulex compressa]|nr:hypothetical protein KM043_010156 [Ampulex compressa]